ncbi:hypothetical protein CVS40_2052 [Lucilia cuprina]|nr:hypothetical protein CVS40_2052 [Lucilia cuprina]
MHYKSFIIPLLTGLSLQPLTAWPNEDAFIYEYISAFPYLHVTQDLVWFISEQLDGYMGVLVTTGFEDPIMLAHYRHLIGRHYSVTFVIYTGKVVDLKPIRDICYALYQGNFVNSVVYFQTSEGLEQVYSIEMFPKFKMINGTDYKEFYKKMKQRISSASQDVQGYRFLTPLKQDIPNVFAFRDEINKEWIFQGTSYSILKTFFRSINGSLGSYDNPKDNNTNLSNIVNMQEPDDDLEKSYPLMVLKWCLMVPLSNKISTFFYTLQPFEEKVWYLIIISLMVLCIKDFICQKCKGRSTYKTFWLNNICHMLNISPARSIAISHLSSFLYYASIFFFGFFLSAFYTSYLGSFLTVSLFRAQINNIDDLIASNFSVMIIDYELEFLILEGYHGSAEFMQLLMPVNSSTFYEHQISMNTSYAYFITDDRWRFLNECQNHLKQKPFKFSEICFGSYHLAYPMQMDSPIWRDLEYFLFHLHASGLFQMYENKALQNAFKGGILKRLEESKSDTFAVTLLLLLILAFWRTVLLWDMQFLLNNMLPLSSIMQTQEINWFISERLDSESSEHLDEFFNTIHRHTSITQMVFTNNSDIRIIRTASKRNYMGIVLSTGPTDPIMWVHDRVLLGRHYYMNFVILIKPLEDFTIAERILRKLHRNNFQNSFLYVGYLNGSSDLLGITAYPEFDIELRTHFLRDLKKSMGKVLAGGMDCQGFKFYTPLRLDLPGVFRYYNKRNIVEKQGIGYRILNLFIGYINASIEPYPMPADHLGGIVVNMKDTLELIRNKTILITAHAYALFETDDTIDKSYPLMAVRWCLMVPLKNTISTFYYPIKPFAAGVWYILIFTFFILATTDCLWIIWESQKDPSKRPHLMWYLRCSILDNLYFMLNIAASKNIKRPSWVRFFLYSTVFFQAFFLSSGYTSLLGSILAVTLFRDEINTLEDLIKANISTLIIDYEYDFLLEGQLNLPYDFLKLIIPVDSATFYHHQSRLNQSYAYFVTDEKWHFLQLQQTSLKQGLFKFTDICFGSFHLAFPMETDSPLWRNLEYFIYRVHSSGMLHYYESISFEHAVYAGYVQRFSGHNDYQAAGLSHVSMVFLMLIVVSAVCVLIFLGECLHYRLQKSGGGNLSFKLLFWK